MSLIVNIEAPSGAPLAPAVPPLAVAMALGCTPDHLRVLVQRGLLDPPAIGAGGRRVWTPDQVGACKSRLAVRPDRAAMARRALAQRRASSATNPAASAATDAPAEPAKE